jgi:hypothetical protein
VGVRKYVWVGIGRRVLMKGRQEDWEKRVEWEGKWSMGRWEFAIENGKKGGKKEGAIIEDGW